MNDAQNTLQELLDNLVRDGRERGVQLVAYLNGQKVVDAFAGNRDPGGHPVMGDTLFPVFSVTKGIAATVLHLLVERGRISYETRIADVWPEFAAAGKDQITLDDALSHLSGVPYMPLDIKPEEVCDWDVMCAAICRLAPIPEPRPRVYHAMTYGWIIGEVARRVDGRTFDRMVQEEICQPLGMEDLYIGLPDSMNSRVAELDEEFPPGFVFPDDSIPRDVPSWMWPLHAWMNRPFMRRACIPASNGVMTARSLARHYAALLPGGVDGVQLLPPSRVRAATTLRLPDPLAKPASDQKIALGYFLMDPTAKTNEFRSFGHAGYGGSIGFATPQDGLAVGFTKNFYSPRGATDLVLRFPASSYFVKVDQFPDPRHRTLKCSKMGLDSPILRDSRVLLMRAWGMSSPLSRRARDHAGTGCKCSENLNPKNGLGASARAVLVAQLRKLG